jgi:hypothetical protein
MSNITRSGGIVISWGGEVEGPVQMLNPMGASTGWSEFKTSLAIQCEICEMGIHVEDSAMDILGRTKTPERDALARRCVARFVEGRCEDSRKKLPEHKEYFPLTSTDIRSLLESAQRNRTKLICTVELPVAGAASESHDIEVFDPSNAITMLRGSLPSNRPYNWDLARVTKQVPIE